MATPPFKVKAVYDYSSPHEDDLSFSNGQIVTVTDIEDDDWYVGEYMDASGSKKEGLFPKNFVETYEPEPPPRPIRGARAKNADLADNTKDKEKGGNLEEGSGTRAEPEKNSQSEPKQIEAVHAEATQTTSVKPEQLQEEVSSMTVESPPPAPKLAPAVPATTKGPPPAVAEKPSSFRDRIAAFNKPTAPPIAPFKPSNAPAGFIKKPFVAPPPSRDAYIPPQRENQPPKPVLREDSVEASQTEQDEQSGMAMSSSGAVVSATNSGEEAPKATSLKERIALLQKQQLEQAARRADQVQKDKPKKPSKKLTDTSEKSGGQDENIIEPGTHRNAEESGTLTSQQVVESPGALAEGNERPLATQGTYSLDRDVQSDGYNAHHSGAVESTEHATATSITSVNEDDGRAIEVPSTEETANRPVNQAESSEEEDDMDPETKRRMELRERMAKMSGGMGMPGMFNPFGGAIRGGTPKKKSSEKPMDPPESQAPKSSQKSQRVSITPASGASRQLYSPSEPSLSNKEYEDEPLTEVNPDNESQRFDEDAEELHGAPKIPIGSATTRDPPPIPLKSRSSTEEAQAASDAPRTLHSPNIGYESDDELSLHAKSITHHDPGVMSRDVHPTTKLPLVANDVQSPTSPEISSTSDSAHSPEPYQKRPSRPPPIPRSSYTTDTTPLSSNRRPPPPLPPSNQDNAPPAYLPTNEQSTPETMVSGMVARKSLESASEEQNLGNRPGSSAKDVPDPNSYIASNVRTASEKSPVGHRGAPPPIPRQSERKSAEISRAPPSIPPPIPSNAAPPLPYTVHRQNSATAGPYMPKQEYDDDDLYTSSPIRKSLDKSSFSHARSPILPSSPHPAAGQASPRPSRDYSQASGGLGRKSMDHSRVMNDQEYIASDVDLEMSSKWWTQPNSLPPVFRDRNDILYEIEESAGRGERMSIKMKNLYVLYRDYSQTIISVEYDNRNVHGVRLVQQHNPPPPRLRQDQLEEAHSRFGLRLSEAVAAKQNTVVGDGSPQALVMDLLKGMPSALWPVGTRAYGALVYANIANATVQQYDEIRAGDILTLRNAKLQGKHGTMHQKYAIEVGKPDHVGVVVDWDGTKKKVRAWEQGRESKKVKIESYRIGDLKSGEVRVWRVMSRSWVGWGSSQ